MCAGIVFRWLRMLLPASVVAGCVQALDIEPADVDPDFEQTLREAAQLASSDEAGECSQRFDNSRVTHMPSSGRLPPLPEAP